MCCYFLYFWTSLLCCFLPINKESLVRKVLSEAFQGLYPVSQHRFGSVERMVEGLKNEQTDAIDYILGKTKKTVGRMVRTAGQNPELTADLLHDGLLILIKKINDGVFDTSKSSPQTYLVSICYKLLSNHRRHKTPPPVKPIEDGDDFTSEELRDSMDQKHRIELIELLLKELGPPGNDLIRLKYLEGYTDEEQIKKKMTPYSSLDSLKTSRNQYLKKLAVMAKKWKEEFHAS